MQANFDWSINWSVLLRGEFVKPQSFFEGDEQNQIKTQRIVLHLYELEDPQVCQKGKPLIPYLGGVGLFSATLNFGFGFYISSEYILYCPSL